MLELPLPGIDASRVRVHSDDQVCHAGAESRALPEEDWRLLEAPLMAGTLPACQLLRSACYVTTETPDHWKHRVLCLVLRSAVFLKTTWSGQCSGLC